MKTALRKRFKDIRSSLDAEFVKNANEGILKNITSLKEFDCAKSVFVYLSCNSEADTNGIIEYCIKKGKDVLVPVTDTKKRLMTASRIGELKVGAYGIREPVTPVTVEKDEIDIIIVPALAFTRDGHRLGYGGGYYDRYLADYKGFTVGICYSPQLTNDVMAQPHDIAVNAVITENEVIK